MQNETDIFIQISYLCCEQIINCIKNSLQNSLNLWKRDEKIVFFFFFIMKNRHLIKHCYAMQNRDKKHKLNKQADITTLAEITWKILYNIIMEISTTKITDFSSLY